MASLNRVQIIGHLGKDVDMRYTPDGSAVANFSVATTESWKDKSGDKKSSTEWHRIVFFAKLAEIAGEYLKKGSSVYIEGRLQTRKWSDKEGIERYSTEIIGDKLQMLGKRDNPGEQHAHGQSGNGSDHGGQEKRSSSFDDLDDDIPFS